MKNLSLKQKILLSVVIALSLVILLLSWQSYSSQKSLLLQGSQEQLQRLGTQQAERVSDWLAARRDVIQALGNKAGAEPLNALQQAQVSGRFQLTYFGESSGKMNDSDPSINRDGYDPRSRGWYQEAMSKGGLIVTKPYLDVAYNIMVVTLAQPVSGGVVGGDLSIASLVEDVTKMQLPADGFAIMMHKDGTIIAYKDAAKAMKPASEIDNDLTNALIEQSKSSKDLVPAYFDSEGRDKLLWAADIPDTDWELVLVLDKAALEAPLSSLLMTQLGMALLVLVGSILAISWLVSMLLGPLTKVSQALARIADGNGDLTQRIKIDANDEVGQLANSFNRFVGSQHQLIGNIRQLANELNADAERSLVTNQAAVDELQRQQQEVTMVATAVTEMASATMEIAGNAENTAAAAQQSAQSSEQGKMLVNKTRQSINGLAEEVGQATEVIGELSRHAQAITSILSTIQGIAEQTNLLALNAAIEAARAGEQGRGFAVVADEVRVLSRRTQDSTQQIQSTIETLQQTTARAVSLMQTSQGLADNSVQDADQAVRALEEITSAISLISDMAGQIATAAEEQTQVTGEITQNTTAIKDVSDEITASAMRDLDQAHSLKGRAADLNQQVSTFIL
ncbi:MULTISPECIES: methyl-accepting chemotaxis protein [Aeromonas]|uniref:Methyl-accepting chemotaxis protein n=1 Tax=Aeromonas veronii TaxID=654 RepID=A0A2T4N0W4_AERVE|nr:MULTISPECIES: methyl-accepting chemotaxis protein [Aeromonas]AXV22581.1 methyl-accepting chemotaxis protein [Aeromonas veronii]MBA2797787.1 methyl-accepting chemotaxis protein [Aeromonas veronii]MBL0444014.1 methyl-accepting chemotaxis protein [Aeromonas veronii]MBL0471902.1 methyl-accepting chemotaxis protein [Aeromonas veronii]MBL0565159.1 methyl-accepting chemotaxis protein [Aeromonas veronii]